LYFNSTILFIIFPHYKIIYNITVNRMATMTKTWLNRLL